MMVHRAILRRLVYESNGCLTYRGSLDRGYGKARVVFAGVETTVRVHRHVYQALRGTVPEGLVLDHLCRNRACANPWHLEAVTQGVNVARTPVAVRLDGMRKAAATRLRKVGEAA